MPRKFQRKKEDFACEHCGSFVAGNGYTNHCPVCLWCKHVDIAPGDRAAACGGMMKPIGWTRRKQTFVVVHRCETCGFVRRNRLSPDDSMLIFAKLPQRSEGVPA
jgi:hypothetical protein